MKQNKIHQNRESADATALFQKVSVATGLALLASAAATYASTDYAPAIWVAICEANWYTSGNGHKFAVVHDMEGFYGSTVSTFKGCGYTRASVYYAINSGSGTSGYVPDLGATYTDTDGKPAGEITQLGVREAQYAWHACCWNTYSYGCEHEGFASNPAWYTEAQYQTSGSLYKHWCDTYGIAKDRNHLVGHNEWQNSAWRTYAASAFGIDPNCNTHRDPGPYWDWSHFMDLVNGTPPPAVRTRRDFNGDGKDDYVIFRPSNATWYIRFSSDGSTTHFAFGATGDIPLVGHVHTTTIAEAMVFRPSTGTWYVRGSDGGVSSFVWGQNGDIPFLGDINGDGKDDYIVFRPSDGHCYYRLSSTGSTANVLFGVSGDIPMTSQVTADDKSDLTVFRPSTGQWYVRRSEDGTLGSFVWGQNGDVPFVGDIDGDGKDDYIVFRPSDGHCYYRISSTGSTANVLFGVSGDVPMTSQVNGDNKADLTVFRPSTGTWYVRGSDTGGISSFVWGQNGDIAVR